MSAQICPRCGTPARVVIVQKARVRCELKADGEPGAVLSASRKGACVGYECGGGHVWNEEQTELEALEGELLDLLALIHDSECYGRDAVPLDHFLAQHPRIAALARR